MHTTYLRVPTGDYMQAICKQCNHPIKFSKVNIYIVESGYKRNTFLYRYTPKGEFWHNPCKC